MMSCIKKLEPSKRNFLYCWIKFFIAVIRCLIACGFTGCAYSQQSTVSKHRFIPLQCWNFVPCSPSNTEYFCDDGLNEKIIRSSVKERKRIFFFQSHHIISLLVAPLPSLYFTPFFYCYFSAVVERRYGIQIKELSTATP